MISVITDGTAGLPYRDAAAMKVRVLPVLYALGGKVYHESYLDAGGNPDRLIDAHRGEWMTTHTSVDDFRGAFRHLTRDGGQVLCVLISSRLSGTYSSAVNAAQQVSPERIALVDSLHTAGGLALLVREASRLNAAGVPLWDMKEALLKRRQDVGVVFSVNDMTALRRSGRLGVVRQSVGNMLNLHPILTLEDGIVKSQGVARGTMQSIRTLAAAIPDNATSIVLHHQGADNPPEPLQNAIRARFPHAEIVTRHVGPSLNIHLGPGFIGVAWIT